MQEYQYIRVLIFTYTYTYKSLQVGVFSLPFVDSSYWCCNLRSIRHFISKKYVQKKSTTKFRSMPQNGRKCLICLLD